MSVPENTRVINVALGKIPATAKSAKEALTVSWCPPVIVEMRLCKLLPVLLKVRLTFPETINIDVEVLDVGTNISIVAVNVYGPLLVFSVVDFRDLDNRPIRQLKEQDDRERFRLIDAWVGARADLEYCASDTTNLVEVLKVGISSHVCRCLS